MLKYLSTFFVHELAAKNHETSVHKNIHQLINQCSTYSVVCVHAFKH